MVGGQSSSVHYWGDRDRRCVVRNIGVSMGAEGGTAGWKLSGITAEEYATLLVEYSREIAKDDYVLGATVFTSGGGDKWNTFDTDPCIDEILRLGGNDMTEFQVGQGILAAMQKHGETPVEDEHYLWPDLYSICASAQALYTYSFKSNKVYRSPLA